MNTDILAKIMSAQSDEEREWIVMQFNLDSLALSVREAVWAAAIPHWFDKAFLDALLNKPLSNEEFESLTSLSYVEKFDRGLGSEGYAIEAGFNIHERTRNLLLDKLWKNEHEQYRKLNRLAAEYCSKRNQTNLIWRIETIYHRLMADDDGAVDRFVNQGLEWYYFPHFAYQKLDSLTHSVLEGVESGRVKEDTASWAYYFQKRLYFIRNSRNSQCVDYLSKRLPEHEPSRLLYEQELLIYQEIGDRLGEANCISMIGDFHLMSSEYEKARQRYEYALLIYREIGAFWGETDCILSIGVCYKLTNQYQLAIKTLGEAAQRYRNIELKHEENICLNLLEEIKEEMKEKKQ